MRCPHCGLATSDPYRGTKLESAFKVGWWRGILTEKFAVSAFLVAVICGSLAVLVAIVHNAVAPDQIVGCYLETDEMGNSVLYEHHLHGNDRRVFVSGDRSIDPSLAAAKKLGCKMEDVK